MTMSELDINTVRADLARIAVSLAGFDPEDQEAQGFASDLTAIREWVEREYEIGRRLAMWFTPDAIRDHFDGEVSDLAEFVRSATDEELEAVGGDALEADYMWSGFHDALTEGVKAMIEAKRRET